MFKKLTAYFSFKAGERDKDKQVDIEILSSDVPKDLDYPILFARHFSSAEGKKILSYMKFLALEKNLGPNATSEALFYQEGRRSFFTTIMTLVKQGRD